MADAFAEPGRAARPGWETLDDTRHRVVAAVTRLVEQSAGELVLVGHGTAWTLVVADLTATPPDLSAWARLRTPDLCTLDLDARSIRHGWGEV